MEKWDRNKSENLEFTLEKVIVDIEGAPFVVEVVLQG
jgi:hypothetical protein